MKIGIIIHSHTGHTLSVAEKIKEKFQAQGHLVCIQEVVAVNENPAASANAELRSIPDTTEYDRLVFGAPVRAFSLSPVMLLYLNQLPSLEGKKVSCFVTQQLKFAWMGGNRSIKQMKKAVNAKNGIVDNTGIVSWSNKFRDDLIRHLVNRLT